jgi:cobalt-zinc-cadmium efflux system outer membrane protein
MVLGGLHGLKAWCALVIALPLLCISAPISAQVPTLVERPEPLRLDQAIRYAIEYNPTLSAARREVMATEGQVLQGSLRPNPDFIYQADDVSRVGRTSTAEVGVPFETGGKREARVRAAGLGREVALADLGSAELRLRSAVIAAFFDVLAAQELRATSEESVRLAQRATDIAAKRVAAGKISPVEETRARVAEAGARVALNQSESELRNSRRRLASLWGNTTPNFSEASGDVEALVEPPNAEAILARLSNAPQLRRAQRELERRKSLVTLEQARSVPDFTVSVGVKRSLDVPGEQALVALKVPLPIFNRNQGNLQEALRREDKAAEELQATQTALVATALQTLENVSARRRDADLLRTEVVPGARSTYEAATIGFENGKFSFLEVLDAQRTLIAAKSQYLIALANFHRAQAELESLIGELTSDNER